jgi:hypothetical protein
MAKAFIVGSGPSIRHINPNLDGIVICINESIMKFPNADYFFSCDARVTLKKGWTYLPDHKCKVVLVEDGCHFDCYYHARGISYKDEIAPERLIKPKRAKTKVFGEKLIWGQNSAHCAANFAYNLGCDTIVLLGCDCDKEDGKQYFWEFEGQPEGGFVQEGFRRFVKELPYCGAAANFEWEQLAEFNPDVRFINCSAGKIKGIENMKLEDL